jgi:transcriptional regulator with XRE-family HTH domain
MNGLGHLLRELRGKKSLREIAEITGLSHSYIADIEKGYRRGSKTPLNPSPETLKRLSEAYDYSYEELMKKAGYLQGDNHTNDTVPAKNKNDLTSKEERDIAKDLERMLQDLESKEAMAFDGEPTEEDEETLELLKSSLEHSMRIAKKLAKKKFTPKKYKN